jgi:hypothetical protein
LNSKISKEEKEGGRAMARNEGTIGGFGENKGVE